MPEVVSSGSLSFAFLVSLDAVAPRLLVSSAWLSSRVPDTA
jgi:hypothetical protein